MDLKVIKQYLRIPDEYTEEDEMLNQLVYVAETYIYNATGKAFMGSDVTLYKNSTELIKEFEMYEVELAEILLCGIVSSLYDERSYTVDAKTERKISLLYSSIIRQLKYS